VDLHVAIPDACVQFASTGAGLAMEKDHGAVARVAAASWMRRKMCTSAGLSQSQVGGTERQTRRDVFVDVNHPCPQCHIDHRQNGRAKTSRRHPGEGSPTLAIVKKPSEAELDALIADGDREENKPSRSSAYRRWAG
jgi:hypothetical protein